MYNFVFLLIFSGVTVATEGRAIKLDISFKTDETTKNTEIQCFVDPRGPQRVVEGQNILFHITTRSKLIVFWCKNAKDRSVFSPTIRNIKNEGGVQVWEAGSIIDEYTMSYMNGAWTCGYKIHKPHHMIVNTPGLHDIVESQCNLEFEITVPIISLDISQLKSQWVWRNVKQREKDYNYTFTEGMATFDCVLSNPTEYEEIYMVAFYLDSHQTDRVASGILRPHSNYTLTSSFNLTKDNSDILCSATHVRGSTEAPSPANHIKLLHVPPSRESPATASTHELSTENVTQGYHVPSISSTSRESPAPPSTSQPSADDVTPGYQIPSCPTISWPFWVMTALALMLFVALVVLILKCRNTAEALQATRNELRQIEEDINESAVMAHRAAMAAPPELLYESVYAHGAGLLRRPQK